MDVHRVYAGVRDALQQMRRDRRYREPPSFPGESSLFRAMRSLLDAFIAKAKVELDCSKCGRVSVSRPDVDAVIACLDLPDDTERRVVGRGQFGVVYAIKPPRGKTRAVKIEPVDHAWRLGHEKNPVDILCDATNIAQRAGDAGIGPRVYTHFACTHASETWYVTVMDMLVGSPLTQWRESVHEKHWSDEARLKRLLRRVRTTFDAKFERLTSMKIMHNDLWNPANVFVEHPEGKPDQVRDVKLLDYGWSTPIAETVARQVLNIHHILEYESTPMRVLRHLVADGVVTLDSTI